MSAQLRLVEPKQHFPVSAGPASKRCAAEPRIVPDAAGSREAHEGKRGKADMGTGMPTPILIAFRHGLRASEICDLEWSQVEFSRSPSLHVRRVKNGKPSVHPLRGDEIRALRELRR